MLFLFSIIFVVIPSSFFLFFFFPCSSLLLVVWFYACRFAALTFGCFMQLNQRLRSSFQEIAAVLFAKHVLCMVGELTEWRADSSIVTA